MKLEDVCQVNEQRTNTTKPCIFPFIFNVTTYNECSLEDAAPENIPWWHFLLILIWSEGGLMWNGIETGINVEMFFFNFLPSIFFH